MESNTEIILSQSGIEIWVDYTIKNEPPHYEEGHGIHQIGGGRQVVLDSVSLIIANKGINILPLLSPEQITAISYELSIY